jgi:hypothetical protein
LRPIFSRIMPELTERQVEEEDQMKEKVKRFIVV